MDPLARLFGSNARLKLLRLFLFNDDQSFTVPDAAVRAKVPKDATRRELNALVTIGILKKRTGKGGTFYFANPRFAHLAALKGFLRATTTVGDAEMLTALRRSGTLRLVILSGIFSGAADTKVDLLVVGDRLDDRTLEANVHKLEAELGRELRYTVFSTEEFRYRVGAYDRLIRDIMDFPHKVLLDRLVLSSD